jgi:hypothetical protein
MKYQKAIDRIHSGSESRANLRKLLGNAQEKFKAGDDDAKAVIDAIDLATPKDQYILFMGYCPNADLNNRLDIEWRAKGICTFDWEESAQQMANFQEVRAGDLVILKKVKKFGKTMEVSGHGRVKSVARNDKGNNYLVMDWHAQTEKLEVPLMGCGSTVNIKPIEAVEDNMPN